MEEKHLLEYFSNIQVEALFPLIRAAKSLWDDNKTLPMEPLREHLRNCFEANLSTGNTRLALLTFAFNKNLAHGECKDVTNTMISNLISQYKNKYFEFRFKTRRTNAANMPSKREAQKKTDTIMGMLKKAGVFASASSNKKVSPGPRTQHASASSNENVPPTGVAVDVCASHRVGPSPPR